MSHIKNILLTVEDLVIQAYEAGACNDKEVIVYVRDRVPAASVDMVEAVTRQLFSFIDYMKHSEI